MATPKPVKPVASAKPRPPMRSTTPKPPAKVKVAPRPALKGKAADDRVLSQRRTGGRGGIDLPKFASEVSTNYARGVAKVGQALDKAIPKTRAFKPPSPTQSKKNNQALKKALGK